MILKIFILRVYIYIYQMALPYISLDDTFFQKRKPRIADEIILFNPNLIEVVGGGNIKFTTPVGPYTVFRIEGNILNDEVVDRDFIMIAPVDISTDSETAKLKTHIKNVKQLLSVSGDGQMLEGDMKAIFARDELIDIFSSESFPRYELDNMCEKQDTKLIAAYCKNIKQNYNFSEFETELRTFQNIDKYGGVSNTLNSHQFNRIIDIFSESDRFHRAHDGFQETLDILISPSIPNLRFTLIGKDAIRKYCSTNIIPKNATTEAIFKGEYSNKLTGDELSDPTLIDYYSNYFGSTKKFHDFNKGVFNLYSLRTKLGGKVEIPLELVGSKWVLNRDSVSKSPQLDDLLDKAAHAADKFNKMEAVRGTKYLKLFRLKSRTTFIYNSVIKIDLTKVKSSKKEVLLNHGRFDLNMVPKRGFIDSGIVGENISYEVEIELINTDHISMEEFQENVSKALNIVKYMNSIIEERPGFMHTNLRNNVLSTYKAQVEKLMNDRYVELRRIGEVTGVFNPRTIKNYYISPKVKGLDINEIQPPQDAVSPHDPSIMTKYCVTEKADGLANMLFVYSTHGIDVGDELYETFDIEGYLFYIDSNLQIYNSYILFPIGEQWVLETQLGDEKNPSHTDTAKPYLFNGEFLNYDKHREPIHKFGIYDAYIYGGVDKCSLILQQPTDIIDPDAAAPTDRISLATKFVNNLEYAVVENSAPSGASWNIVQNFCKKFYVANDIDNIFNQSKKIWDEQDQFEYKLDGLIYTPYSDPVGYTPRLVNYSLNPSNTWHRNLKWKPLEENTIDFLIRFKKYESSSYNGSSIYKNEIVGKPNSKDQYAVIEFYNNGKVNGKSKPVRFYPTNYPDEECIGLFKLDVDNNIVDLEGNLVKDDTIVEVSYIPGKSKYDQFSILRTRHDKTYQYRTLINYQKETFKKIQKAIELMRKKTNKAEYSFLQFIQRKFFTKRIRGENVPLTNVRDIEALYKDYSDVYSGHIRYNFGNSQYVAGEIWKAIHLPITEHMITTGDNIPSNEDTHSAYYKPKYKTRGESLTLNLQNYHNKYIKSDRLIKTVVRALRKEYGFKYDISLLDLACGKGGDIFKWQKNHIHDCVGIDISDDNIRNAEDGAWVRYGRMKEKSAKVPTMVFGTLNTSLNLQDNLPEIFTEGRKFDILSVMFALHYFFKDITTLDGFIKNVVDNIKVGGYLIGACFDGDKIYDTLAERRDVQYTVGEQTLLRIDKQYSDDKSFVADASSLGLQIQVDMYTIGTVNVEYLVNFDYFESRLAEHGISRVEITKFEDIGLLPSEIKKHLRLKNMTSVERQISDLNSLFIFKKD